jgi:hypothetical protein
MVNQDGRAHWFDAPNTASSSRSGKKPVDNDGDGLFDEDGYDDIDGDGEILGMWKANPEGAYRRDPEDPRLLVRVKPGERGELEYLGLEGLDNDGDGRINEDSPGGYDMNRNWPVDWQPEPTQRGAGDYPLSFPETRAVADFILAHPNIAGVQAYHNAGGMILRGPGDERLEADYPRQDVRVYDELGQTGEFTLPLYRYLILWKDLYRVHGGFLNWTYEELGIFSFTNELWTAKQYGNLSEGARGWFGSVSKDRLRWDDLLEMGEQFVELKPARHPLYGEILLGGLRKTGRRLPPLFLLEELCHRNEMFTIYHASEMPLVSIESVEVELIAGKTYYVTVTIHNAGAIPTRSAIAAQKHIGRPDLLEIVGDGVAVLQAGRLLDRYTGELSMEGGEDRARLPIEGGIRGKDTARFRFLVRGEGPVTVRFRSEKGGLLERSARLEPTRPGPAEAE